MPLSSFAEEGEKYDAHFPGFWDGVSPEMENNATRSNKTRGGHHMEYGVLLRTYSTILSLVVW